MGPENEASQELSCTVTTDNKALFIKAPVHSATGGLTYAPAKDANSPGPANAAHWTGLRSLRGRAGNSVGWAAVEKAAAAAGIRLNAREKP